MFWRDSIPVIRQQTPRECGLACLAMALSHLGRPTPLEDIRKEIEPGARGVTAADLVRLAERFGAAATGVQVELDQAQLLPVGSILHWDFAHFVVLEREPGPGGVEIIDPGLGRRLVTHPEFWRRFTGTAILVEGSPRPAMPARNSLRPLRRLLSPAAWLLLLVAIAASLASALAMPALAGGMVEALAQTPRRSALLPMAGACLGTAILGSAAVWIRRRVLSTFKARFDGWLARTAFERLVLGADTATAMRSRGEAVGTLSLGAQSSELLSVRLLSTCIDALHALVAGGVLCAIAWIPGICALLGLVGPSALVLLGQRRREQRMNEEILEASFASSGAIDVLDALEAVRASSLEQLSLHTHAERVARQEGRTLERERWGAWLDSAADGWVSVCALGAALASAWPLSAGPRSWATAVTAAGLAWVALAGEGRLRQMVERVIALYRTLPRHVLRPSPCPPEASPDRAPLRGAFELVGASATGDGEVLEEVSLTIRPGQLVVIGGPPGSGRRTLLSLLLGVRSPIAGQVRVDGEAPSEARWQALREQAGVLLQGTPVVWTTLGANAARAGRCPDPQLLRSAAQITGAESVWGRFPLKEHMPVSELREPLSELSRHRLGLTRALYDAPSLLVLEDPLRLLPAEDAARVLSFLRDHRGTRIIASNDEELLRLADVVVVLDRGRIVDSGPPAILERQSVQAGHDGAAEYPRLIQRSTN